MSITEVQPHTERPVQLDAGGPSTALLAVVAFDGTAASRAALEAAAQLIQGRSGHLSIVYVAHVPVWAAMSSQAVAGIQEGFGVIAAELQADVRKTLDDREPRWDFQRRDGSVTEQLLAAATELRRQHGPETTVVIITGASTRLAHHIAGSVAVALARDAGFPLLIVPAPTRTQPIRPHPSTVDPAVDASTYLG